MRYTYPRVVPALSLQPAGERMLIGRTDSKLPVPLPGMHASANILTFEAVSYQAKGRWLGGGNPGQLVVQEVYAGGLPFPVAAWHSTTGQ